MRRSHSRLPEPRPPTRSLPADPMVRSPDLLAALLGLGLGAVLTLPGAGAAGCRALGPADRLVFAPAAKARWLPPRVRAPGPLDSLYGTVRGFLSVVQLNPFPAGECAPPPDEPGRVWVPSLTLIACPPRGAPTLGSHLEGRVPSSPHPRLPPQKLPEHHLPE